ncbi:MAG: hypothetical protein JRI97_12805 [Deltaproteobacteria bacterium]|nr:hypothetical protein [Deltaproteobacteria bacterium]
MEEEPIINVEVLANEVEARLLAGVLEDRDIPHVIVSYHDTAYDGLFQAQRGWGVVRAPESEAEGIREILFDLRSGAGLEEDAGQDLPPPE